MRPLTREAYLNAVTHFVNWLQQTYSDEFDPQEVIARDIREWKNHQQTVEKASPNTINLRLVAIGRLFSWAHGENIIQMNPAADVDLINVSELKPKGLDSRSLRQLLRAIHKYGSRRDIAVIELLAGTGLRVSELLFETEAEMDMFEVPYVKIASSFFHDRIHISILWHSVSPIEGRVIR